jgi:hypothetical protein
MANPGYLASQNMEMLSGGKVINASAIDWTQTNIQQFHIRQRPGSRNALGQVKFLFPNQHDIYLHDTPSKSLFARSFPRLQPRLRPGQNPMVFAGRGARAQDHAPPRSSMNGDGSAGSISASKIGPNLLLHAARR